MYTVVTVAADLLAFVAVSSVVIATPGQDTALTIKNTLGGGRRAGVFTALGVVTGQLTWASATSLGLAGLLRASEPAFAALKLLGAAYLVYLGASTVLASFRSGEGGESDDRRHGLAPRAAYRQGVLSNLGNPKIAVFFTSLLPQFASGGTAFATSLLLGALFAAMTLVWLSCYAFVVEKAGNVLRRPRARRALSAVTGSVLVGLGLRLAIAER
jgi:threonine/homoserine/homoserine lactone efflux protein